MKILADKNLAKDLSKLDKKHTIQLLSLIEIIKNSNTPSEILGIKKLEGVKDLFRIRMGKFRIGLRIENDTIILIRILHRKDIYRYFPILL